LARAEEEAQTKLTEADRQIEHKQKSEEERLYQEAVDLAISAMSQLYDRELSKEEALALERSIGKEGSLEA
jgi:F0F1-type ATP synthase membrane subunit b/b'